MSKAEEEVTGIEKMRPEKRNCRFVMTKLLQDFSSLFIV